MQAQIDDNHQNLALHFNFRKIEPSENGQFHQIFAPKAHVTVEDGFEGEAKLFCGCYDLVRVSTSSAWIAGIHLPPGAR
jgi:hypothetical protein